MKIDYDFTTPFWEVSFLRPVIGGSEDLDCPRKFKYEKRWNEGEGDFPPFQHYIDEIHVNYSFADGLYGGIFGGSISLRPDIETTQKFMTDKDSWWKFMTGIKIRYGYRGPSPNAATKPFIAWAVKPTGSLTLQPDIGFEFNYMGSAFTISDGLILQGTKQVADFITEIANAFNLKVKFDDADQAALSREISLSSDAVQWPKKQANLKLVLNAFLHYYAGNLDYIVLPGETKDDDPVLRILNRPVRDETSTPKLEVMFVWGRPIDLQADPPVVPIEDFEADTNWNFYTRAFTSLEGPDDMSVETKSVLRAKEVALASWIFRSAPIPNERALTASDENAQRFGLAGMTFLATITTPCLPNLLVGNKVGLMIGNNFIGGTKGTWQVLKIGNALTKSGFKSKIQIFSRPAWLKPIYLGPAR